MAWRFTRITYSLVDCPQARTTSGGVPHGQLRLGQPERDVCPSSSARMRCRMRQGAGAVPFCYEQGTSVSLLEAPPGGFAKKANVARRPRRGDGVD